LSAEGSQALEKRVTHLQVCHLPKTASKFRPFLGMLKYHTRFLPHAAARQAQLHDVLSGPKIKGTHPTTWNPELLKSFEECKKNLSRVILLGHPDPTAPPALVTDAPTSAMGAVLLQHVENAW
jgi:hypothetical protein